MGGDITAFVALYCKPFIFYVWTLILYIHHVCVRNRLAFRWWYKWAGIRFRCGVLRLTTVSPLCLQMVSFSHFAFSMVTFSLSLLYYFPFSLYLSFSLFLPFCRLSFSITDRMHTECILSSTGSVLKIYSLSQKSYETLLSEYHGSVLALIKANNVNFKRWWSNVWWNCQKVVAALLCVLKLSFSGWRFFFSLFFWL